MAAVSLFNLVSSLRACLHEDGGPQVGEVTCGGLPHLTCKRDYIKMRDYSIWTGGLPHLPGVPQLLFKQALTSRKYPSCGRSRGNVCRYSGTSICSLYRGIVGN